MDDYSGIFITYADLNLGLGIAILIVGCAILYHLVTRSQT